MGPTFTARVRAEFLKHLAVGGNASAAARAVGLSYSTVAAHYKTDEDFAREWDDTLRLAGGTLEAAVMRRAVEGVPRKLYFKGEPVIDPETGEHAVEVQFDTSREALLLKRFMPEEYRERTDARINARVQRTDMDDETLIARARQIIEDAELRAEGERPDGVRDIAFRELPPPPADDDVESLL